MKEGCTIGDFTELILDDPEPIHRLWLDNVTGKHIDLHDLGFFVLHDNKILINKKGHEFDSHAWEQSYNGRGIRIFKDSSREGIWMDIHDPTFKYNAGRANLDILLLDIDSIAYRFKEQVWDIVKT